MFRLDEQLALDTLQVEDWELCRVRLMNDCRFPWVMLVPRRTDLRDMDEVREGDKPVFYEEIERATQALRQATQAYKMNVAALGNQVPQLHVHVIARFPKDAAWPGPVWGAGDAVPYPEGEAEVFARRFSIAAKTLSTTL